MDERSRPEISALINFLLTGFVFLVLALSVLTIACLYEAGFSISPVFIAVFMILALGGYAVIGKSGGAFGAE